MYLTTNNLVHYLFASNILNLYDIFERQITIVETGCRNRNFLIALDDSPGFFAKQVDRQSSLHRNSLKREADFYRIAKEFTLFESVIDFLPTFIKFDSNRCCLVVKRIPHCEDLTGFINLESSYLADAFGLLGVAIAKIHAIPRSSLESTLDCLHLDVGAPWILTLHKIENGRVGAGAELVAIIKKCSEINSMLDRLESNWHRFNLIHGDMKFRNCLVNPALGKPNKVYIIDWEMLQWGDPYWDIAGVLQSFIATWINSMAYDSTNNSIDLVLSAGKSINTFHPASRAFIIGYCREAALNIGRKELIKLMEMTAARLIQSVSEWNHDKPVLDRRGQLAMQVCQNLCKYPIKGASDLFGISLGYAI